MNSLDVRPEPWKPLTPENCPHHWEDSRQALGLVGTLYPSIYPWVCLKCNSLKHADGTIFPGKAVEAMF